MEKMTKRNVYMALVNFATTGELSYEGEDGVVMLSNEALEEFAKNEIVQLDKKAEKAKESAQKRRAAKADASDVLMEAVVAALSVSDFESSADIALRVPNEDATLAKISYRLTQLVKNGIAEKQTIKVAGEDGKSRTVQGYRLTQLDGNQRRKAAMEE